MDTAARATLADLSQVEGKTELIDGEIVSMPPTGAWPGYAGDEIFASLREYCKRTGVGRAVGDNKGFLVNLPNHESFSPDVAYYVGADPQMCFYQGAPRFAAAIRSDNDYGPAAERAMAQKRTDYFAAGTLVVWDVDLLSTEVVTAYRASDPAHPIRYRRGEMAAAEPAVPGWRMAVDDLFV